MDASQLILFFFPVFHLLSFMAASEASLQHSAFCLASHPKMLYLYGLEPGLDQAQDRHFVISPGGVAFQAQLSELRCHYFSMGLTR